MTSDYQNKEQDRRIECLENHWVVLNDEFGSIKNSMSEIKTDVCWLKQWFWVVAGASVSGLIVAVINLIIKVR
jgi:hypothetical protein